MLVAADALAAVFAGVLVAAIAALPLVSYVPLALVAAATWVATAFACGLYSHEDMRLWVSGVTEAPRLMAASIVFSWPLLGTAFLLGADHPAIAALVAAPAIALASALGRAGARAIVHRMTPLRQRTLIVGSGFVASQIANKLKAFDQFGLDPVGLVDDDPHEMDAFDLPRLGRLDALPEVLKEHSVDRVVIAFSRAGHLELLATIRACRGRRIAIDIVPRLFEFLDGAQGLDQIAGVPIMSIGAPTLSTPSRAAKRALDIVFSGAALALLSPVFAAIALAIKLESRGPVLFRQRRPGQGHAAFEMVKFRSMHRDADQRKLDFTLHNDMDDGVMFKIKQDPRVTRVGRLLRRLSLDEMPQLLNVLLGHMSLVGPRPVLFEEIAALEEGWPERRLDLRPGLTGTWQISGRSEIPFEEMIRFDYQYVAGWSLSRDLEILLATFPAVLSGRGAY